jgi:hypothetical protein
MGHCASWPARKKVENGSLNNVRRSSKELVAEGADVRMTADAEVVSERASVARPCVMGSPSDKICVRLDQGCGSTVQVGGIEAPQPHGN